MEGKKREAGVPWDVGTLRAKEAALITDGLISETVNQETILKIMQKGNKLPYTQAARNAFAQRALFHASDKSIPLDKALDAAFEQTLDLLERQAQH